MPSQGSAAPGLVKRSPSSQSPPREMNPVGGAQTGWPPLRHNRLHHRHSTKGCVAIWFICDTITVVVNPIARLCGERIDPRVAIVTILTVRHGPKRLGTGHHSSAWITKAISVRVRIIQAADDIIHKAGLQSLSIPSQISTAEGLTVNSPSSQSVSTEEYPEGCAHSKIGTPAPKPSKSKSG